MKVKFLLGYSVKIVIQCGMEKLIFDNEGIGSTGGKFFQMGGLSKFFSSVARLHLSLLTQ